MRFYCRKTGILRGGYYFSILRGVNLISHQEEFFLARNVYSYEKRKKELDKKKKKEQKRLLKLERKMNKEGESDPLADNP